MSTCADCRFSRKCEAHSHSWLVCARHAPVLPSNFEGQCHSPIQGYQPVAVETCGDFELGVSNAKAPLVREVLLHNLGSQLDDLAVEAMRKLQHEEFPGVAINVGDRLKLSLYLDVRIKG